jgi:outer membrane protein TolC
MKTTSILLAMLLCWGVNAQAQTVEEFSLSEAVGYAQAKSNSVRSAQLDIARAKADVQEYTAIGIPKVNAEVDYNYFIDIPVQLLPNDAFAIPGGPPVEPGFTEVQFGTRQNLTPSLTVSTLVVDGSYFVGLKASKGLLDMTKRQADLTQYDLKYQVIQAYLQALLVEENKEVLLRNIENLKTIRFETNAFYENGMVERLDVDRLDLSLSNLQVQLDALNRQTQLAKNLLKYQMNYPLQDSIVLTERLEEVLAIAETADLEGDIAYDRRIETDILRRTIALNELNIKRFHMGYLPNITAFFTHQQQLQRNDLFDDAEPGFFPTTIVGATLNVPIFDGLDKAAKIKRARIDVAKFQLQLNDLERGIQLEVVNARATYRNAKERLESQNANVALAERILETTRIKYREGVGSSIEMTQAEQELYSTQANRLNALYDLVLAKAALDKALGK